MPPAALRFPAWTAELQFMRVSASRNNIRKSNSTFLTEAGTISLQHKRMHDNATIGRENNSILAIVLDNEGRWSFLSSFAPLRHSLLHLPFSDCHVLALGWLLIRATAPTKKRCAGTHVNRVLRSLLKSIDLSKQCSPRLRANSDCTRVAWLQSKPRGTTTIIIVAANMTALPACGPSVLPACASFWAHTRRLRGGAAYHTGQERVHLVDVAPYSINRAAAADQGPEICGVCKQEVGAKPWQLKRLQDCGTALRTVNAKGMRDGTQSSTASCAYQSTFGLDSAEANVNYIFETKRRNDGYSDFSARESLHRSQCI